jgi:hypothetical protein
MENETKKATATLFRRRTCLVPTWRGWLLLALGIAALCFFCVREIHPFLAVTDPLHEGALVVEGWAPDYALQEAVNEFKQGHYDYLYVTGGPLARGAPLSEYKTYAQLGAAVLLKLGLSSNVVQAIPTPWIRQDRTYTSAVTLRDWLRAHDRPVSHIDLITEGPHARRSRLMYEKAFGRGIKIGITAIPVRDYDQRRWWRYSAGVRSVVDEAVAYVYARFFFHAAKNETPGP